MKKKNTKFLIAALVVVMAVLIGLFVFMMRGPATVMTEPATITEVTLEDVPAEVKAEMESVLYSPGAYYYSFGEEYYVLLTAGELSGYQLSVDYEVNEDNEADFSIQLLASDTSGSALLYRVYLTDAVAVNANRGALTAPGLEVGAAGINNGYIRPNGDDYYVYPIMDQSIENNLFQGDEVQDLEPGLYSYQFEIRNDGFYLLEAAPLTEIRQTGYLDSYDAMGTALITFVEGGAALEVSYDVDNSDIVDGLAAMAENKGQNGEFTLKMEDGQLVISSLDTLKYLFVEYDSETGAVENSSEEPDIAVPENSEEEADADSPDGIETDMAADDSVAGGETNPGEITNTEGNPE